jgi:2-iminobutanoate/2-iminopropanoate deaminase
MLAAVGSDLDHVLHVDVYLLDIADFAAMNAAYVEAFGEHRPARTAIGVAALPKTGAVVTMGLTAVVA